MVRLIRVGAPRQVVHDATCVVPASKRLFFIALHRGEQPECFSTTAGSSSQTCAGSLEEDPAPRSRASLLPPELLDLRRLYRNEICVGRANYFRRVRLECPKCGGAISKENVALQQGLARCSSCDEYFRLAAHLRTDEEIRRSQKSFDSKVVLDQQQRSVWIPARGVNAGMWFPLLFAGIGLVVLIAGLVGGWDTIPVFMVLFFLVVGVAMMVPSFTTISVVVGGTISVTWMALGFTRTKKGSTRQLMRIAENTVYQRNYQPVYGIGLFFKDGTTITFGSELREEERKWLIGELQELTLQALAAGA